MSVLFKYGKYAVKRYDNLCPNELVYLRAGKCVVNMKTMKLRCMDDTSLEPVDLRKCNYKQFCKDLGIDIGNVDKKPVITVNLDRNGFFSRRSGSRSSIEKLFEGGSK